MKSFLEKRGGRATLTNSIPTAKLCALHAPHLRSMEGISRALSEFDRHVPEHAKVRISFTLQKGFLVITFIGLADSAENSYQWSFFGLKPYEFLGENLGLDSGNKPLDDLPASLLSSGCLSFIEVLAGEIVIKIYLHVEKKNRVGDS